MIASSYSYRLERWGYPPTRVSSRLAKSNVENQTRCRERLRWTSTTNGGNAVKSLLLVPLLMITTSALADVSSGPGNAVAVSVSSKSLTGTFEFPRDEDWYKVKLTAGREYAIEGSPVEELTITLYSPSKSTIATEGVDPNFDSGIEYKAKKTGWYFVKYADASSGPYPTIFRFRISSDCGSDARTTCNLTTRAVQHRLIAFSSDEDWYRMKLGVGGYRIVLDTGGGDAVVKIIDHSEHAEE